MLLSLLTACFVTSTATCGATCDRIYAEDECGIQRPGRTQDELLDMCQEECVSAMRQSGDLGDYDPYERVGSTVSVELDNRAQAQLWAECVDETACDNLTEGWCAPIW